MDGVNINPTSKYRVYNDAIATPEAGGKYSTVNDKEIKTINGKKVEIIKPVDEWAIGRYQHYFVHAKAKIMDALAAEGIDTSGLSKESIANAYRDSPKAQERVQELININNFAEADKLIKKHNLKAPTHEIAFLSHFLGNGGANYYLTLLKKYGYKKADEIMAYGGDPNRPNFLGNGGPKSEKANAYVSAHMMAFRASYAKVSGNNAASEPTPTPAPQQPIKVQPKVDPKVNIKPQPVVTTADEPSILDDVTSGVSDVLSGIYRGVGNTADDISNAVTGTAETITRGANNSYEGLKTAIKQEASNALQGGIKGVGEMSNELYDAINNTFGFSSEDLKNVFNAMENGASLDDLSIMAKSFMSKATGIGTEDLVGKSGSLSATKDAAEVLINWGTAFNKPKENMVKKKYIVDDKQISDTPAVVQGDYTSKAFVLNLKSDKNKFGVLDNIHAGSGVGNMNTFFNNFTPVNGSMVFTAQNDVNDVRTMPLTKIQQGDDWYKDFKYLMRLNNGTLEVVKGKDIKPGDNIFKTANKIFSMDDFDIRDGKINTVYMSGITASIPVTKKTTQNNTKKEYTGYKNGFVLGLTNKYKGGMIPISECDQYGQSKGGSYVIFSEDLDQQYMVGGSFKNLYETYDKLQKQNPDKKFQIIASDTGTYSNSVFPNSGLITGDVYRQSCFRNSYGHVQYMILMN